ncbi:streptophobe family protein [Streptomyces sp. NPDC026672]|uniref:streptophobe family protein n=1 Tax=unclassified Streptomyces TaxID=2593676 RepID=UPI0033DFC846
MSTATGTGVTGRPARLPWGDVLLSAIAAVSWALVGMAGTAALGLHLLEADSAGSLGPMTAAVVALGAGGSVTPSGDVSAFGLRGAEATTAIQITPLGVSLVGALLLSWFFLRSLRTAGVVVAPAELAARAGTVLALFVAVLGGLAWAGHDVVTIDGGELGLDKVPGLGGGNDGGLSIPGLGGLGDVGGLLPDRIGDLVGAKAAVGYTVDTAPTLLGGLVWAAGVLLIALLASRRTPLPAGWEAVHRVVRPAVSALVGVLLMAVVAGLAAAGYAAIGDDHPRRIAGAALLGAPNGVWLGVPLGLFVPWDGRATGPLATLLPDPLDRLLSSRPDDPVTVGRLADLDGRVWLLAVAAALAMLLAGVLTAVRTPVPTGAGAGGRAGGRTGAGRGRGAGGEAGSGRWAGAGPGSVPGVASGVGAAAGAGARYGVFGFVGRCAVRLGVVTALALPVLVRSTDLSVDASLSVLGFDAFGAGVRLHGHLAAALLLGAAWGAGAGAVGALLAWATGSAGRRAAPLARGVTTGAVFPPERDGERAGPYAPGTPYRPPNPATNPYLRLPPEVLDDGDARAGGEPAGRPPYGGGRDRAGRWGYGRGPGPGNRTPYPDARPAEERRQVGPRREERPEERHHEGWSPDGRPAREPAPGDDVSGAPTISRPLDPPPRGQGPRGRGPRGQGPRGQEPRDDSDDWPPPPPPPPGAPRGPR